MSLFFLFQRAHRLTTGEPGVQLVPEVHARLAELPAEVNVAALVAADAGAEGDDVYAGGLDDNRLELLAAAARRPVADYLAGTGAAREHVARDETDEQQPPLELRHQPGRIGPTRSDGRGQSVSPYTRPR